MYLRQRSPLTQLSELDHKSVFQGVAQEAFTGGIPLMPAFGNNGAATESRNARSALGFPQPNKNITFTQQPPAQGN